MVIAKTSMERIIPTVMWKILSGLEMVCVMEIKKVITTNLVDGMVEIVHHLNIPIVLFTTRSALIALICGVGLKN